MRVRPSRDEFRALATDHTIVPVWAELLADLETPVAAYVKLVGDRAGFLLETVEHERWSRFSFVGRDPIATLLLRNGRVEVDGPRPAGLAPGRDVYLADIAAGGDGVLALAYEPDPLNFDARLAVWTSVDGIAWRRVGNGMDRGDASPQAQFVFPDRLVVIGGTDAGRLVVWLGDPVDLP